jgi:hypothetical protein
MLRTENSPWQLAPHYTLLQFETHDKRFMSMIICKSELFKSASNKYIAESTGLQTIRFVCSKGRSPLVILNFDVQQ